MVKDSIDFKTARASFIKNKFDMVSYPEGDITIEPGVPENSFLEISRFFMDMSQFKDWCVKLIAPPTIKLGAGSSFLESYNLRRYKYINNTHWELVDQLSDFIVHDKISRELIESEKIQFKTLPNLEVGDIVVRQYVKHTVYGYVDENLALIIPQEKINEFIEKDEIDLEYMYATFPQLFKFPEETPNYQKYFALLKETTYE